MSKASESRAGHRSYTNMPCHIILPQSDVRMPGKIYNLSQAGGAIEVSAFGKLPDIIRVEVDGRIYTAQVIWRKWKNIGVQFIHASL